MLQFSLSFDSRDIFVSFPVSFRNKCKYKSSFWGADDAEEEEEAIVSEIADDWISNLNSNEDHEELVTDQDHTD